MRAISKRVGQCFPVLLVVGLLLSCLSARSEIIVTGGKTGTYFAIGNNLHDVVSPGLEVKVSSGSWANVEEMSRTVGVTLAIVQSDVYSAFVQLRDSKDVPEPTRREYTRLLANLRVFMPLYPEELHFLVRKNDPMEYIHQIKGKALWMDMEKSGTYLTALNVYSKMFNEKPNSVEPFINTTATGDDEGTKRRRSALMALSDPGYYKSYPKVDVVVLVGGQPLGLLEKNIPGNLKLLKFQPDQPSSLTLLQDYRKAEIHKSSYPQLNIDGNGQPTLAVDSYLITANFADPKRNEFIKTFAGNFCSKLDTLQEKGHPKWKALAWQPGSPLPSLAQGWQYSEKVKQTLANCVAGGAMKTATPVARSANACRDVDRSIGLCK